MMMKRRDPGWRRSGSVVRVLPKIPPFKEISIPSINHYKIPIQEVDTPGESFAP
jgi:hypothetical protein